MSGNNSDRREKASYKISRRKILSASGVGAGGLLLSTVPAGASDPENASDEGKENSERPEWAGSWRDVPGWENLQNEAATSTDVDLTEEEIREGLNDPDNWELYVHTGPEEGELKRFVGEDRNAAPPAQSKNAQVMGQNPYTWDALCWDAPLIGYGCLSARATAKWNEVELAVSAWGYDLWGGSLSWIDNTLSVSAKATVKGFRITFDGWVSLEHVIGDAWEMCVGGEVCVIAEPACVSDSGCGYVWE